MDKYDSHGWLSFAPLDRQAKSNAPTHAESPVVGQNWPNWADPVWVEQIYSVPVPPLPPALQVPNSVTMRQARLALLAFNKLDMVNAAVAAMTGAQGDAARIEWEFSSEVFRYRPLVLLLAANLGWLDSDLDQLFIYAASLT